MIIKEAIDSFILSREAKNCSSRTVRWYELMLAKFQNYLDEIDTTFDNCTVTTLRQYLRHLKKDKHFSDRYILGHYRVLKAFYNYLNKEQLISENPSQRLDKPRQEHKLFPILSPSQVLAILDQPDKTTFEGYRNYVMIKVLYETGIRLSELTKCLIEHTNLEQGYMLVYGKGNKERYVFMGQQLREELQNYLLKREHINSSYLFVNHYGLPVTNRRFQTSLTLYGKKAGIKGTRVSPHTFRYPNLNKIQTFFKYA